MICGMLAARTAVPVVLQRDGPATRASPTRRTRALDRDCPDAVGVADLPVEIEAVRHLVMDARVSDSFRRGQP